MSLVDRPRRRSRAPLLSLLLAGSSALWIAACGGSDGGGGGGTAPPEPEPVSAVINPGDSQIQVGQTLAFSVVVTFDDGSTRTFTSQATWSSSDPSIATISGSGVATGIAPGTVTITASGEGESGTVTLTVVPAPVASVDVSPGEARLEPGATVQLTATPRSSSGQALNDRDVTWSSDDTSVATVDDAGLVTAVAEGEATITASSEGQTGASAITVRFDVDAVEVEPETASILIGGTQQLVARVLGSAGQELDGRAVAWSTSNAAVASVDANGLVTGVSEGSVTITATSEGVDGTATIEVTSVPVASVEVNPTTATIQVSATIQIAATTRDASGNTLTGRTVTWSSSASGVATVSTNGVVSGVAPGTATITATSEGQTAAAVVTVIPIPVATVSVSPATADIFPGGTRQYSVTLQGAGGTTLTGRTVTWASSNPTVATVNASGLVTGLAVGEATITATSEGVDGTAVVRVLPPPVASVDVTPNPASVLVAGTQQLTATPRDGSGNALTGRTVTWSTADATVATVDAAGLVTGVAVGSTTITATSEGIDGTTTVNVVAVPVASVEVSPTSATIAATQTTQLTATTKDAGGNTLTGRSVTWSSNAEGVATVDANGLVTGVAQGSATITATSEGQSASATITVTPAPVATVEVSPASASIVEFGTQQLTTTLRDAGGTVLTGRTVTWSTSASGVATVDSNGLVTGVAVGSATITATSEGQSGTATITVTAAPVASVEVAPTSATIAISGTQQLTATAKDGSGNTLTGRTVTWSSDDTGVATVNASGLVTGVAAGSATITANVEGQTATAAITVTSAPVASVSVSPNNQEILIGATQQLSATLRDASNNELSGRTVTWSSNRTDVATVDSNGLVTGVRHGSVTITATSEGQSGSVSIHIYTASTAGFDITLEFLVEPSAQDRTTFENAAARWEQIITGDTPGKANSSLFSCDSKISEGSIDDLHIFVTVQAIDGVGGTLGQAGACDFGDALPFVGVMTFDVADIDKLRTDGDLENVIIHEMGHVLGIARGYWSKNSLISPTPISTVCNAAGGNPVFVGAATVAAYGTLGGSGNVPLANTGGSGTLCSHWREATFDRELMTGFLDAGVANPLSILTVQSLADIGYTVNTGAADSYTLPGSLLISEDTPVRKIPMHDDVLHPVAATVQPDGTLRVVNPGRRE